MKILFLTDKMGLGGAETHILTLMKELYSRGLDLTLVCAGGIYECELSRCGIKTVYAPFDKRSPVAISKSLRIIKSLIDKFDIIHAHTRFTAFLAKAAQRDTRNAPLVTTAHLNFKKSGLGHFSQWGDLTLAVSEDIKQHLIKEYNINEEKIIVTKNGINPNEFIIAHRSTKRILHISRIDNGRSMIAFMLLDIAERLFDFANDYTIEIVGDGELFPELKRRADKINSLLKREQIKLYGGRNDIANILYGGGIFVGVSRAALEAMAGALPCIIAGDEGYGGILREENFNELEMSNLCARAMVRSDKEVLFSDISRLITDKELRDRTGSLGRKIIEEKYTSKSMADDAIEAYKRAKRIRSVCIFGYIGFGNMGDEATAEITQKVLAEYDINSIFLFTAERKDGRNSKNISRYNLRKMKSALKQSDALILAGGNLLQNETSLRSLLYYHSVIRMARNSGVRIYMLGSGLGELRGFYAKRLAKGSLLSCAGVCLRTKYDEGIAKELGIKNVIYMPDMCFLYEEKERKKEDTFLIIAATDKYIRLLPKIEKQTGLRARVCVIFPSIDKKRVSAICKKMGIELLIPKNAEEFTSLAAGCRFTLSERLHGAIFSILSKTVCYLDTSAAKCRALILDIRAAAVSTDSSDILFPLDSKTKIKKEVGAKSSDFQKIISKLKHRTKSVLDELFK